MTELILEGTDVPQRNFKFIVGGVALPLASLFDYGVNIYSFENQTKHILFKFRKTPDVPNKLYPVIPAATDTGGFIVDRDMTKSLKVSYQGLVLYAELFYKVTASSDYKSSYRVGAQGGYEVAKIITSSTPNDFT